MSTINSFKVGDKATYTIHTDSRAGYITKVSPNGKKVWFVEAEAKLLNGPNSGEPDALEFSPGGFVGHTSGTQRWEIADKPKDGYTPQVFTLRTKQNGEQVWKAVGHGTYSPGCSLYAGHHHHYDYNF